MQVSKRENVYSFKKDLWSNIKFAIVCTNSNIQANKKDIIIDLFLAKFSMVQDQMCKKTG